MCYKAASSLLTDVTKISTPESEEVRGKSSLKVLHLAFSVTKVNFPHNWFFFCHKNLMKFILLLSLLDRLVFNRALEDHFQWTTVVLQISKPDLLYSDTKAPDYL